MLQNNQSSLTSEGILDTKKVDQKVKPGESNKENATMSAEALLELHDIDITLPLACDFCPETFTDFDKFDDHMSHHSEGRFFACQLCSNTYISWVNLVAHRKACHRKEVINCNSCGEQRNHLNLGPINYRVGEYAFGCEECNEGFNTALELFGHYRLRGRHAHRRKVRGMDVSLLEGLHVQPEIFNCPVCRIQFLTEDQLKNHLAEREKEGSSFRCGICDENFCSVQLLVLHKCSRPAKKGRKSLLCTICGVILYDHKEYFEHKLTHLEEKPYQCEWCFKSFIQKTRLHSHKFNHPNVKDYYCFNCGKWYTEISSLKDHIQLEHSSDGVTLTCGICREDCQFDKFLEHYQKCHKARVEEWEKFRQESVICSLCKKVFPQPTALARHVRRHKYAKQESAKERSENKQTFKCDVCNAVLKRQYGLMIHMRTHYGKEDMPEKYVKLLEEFDQARKNSETESQLNFICEYCGREFRHKESFQLHVRRHTGDRPHACQLCDKAFYTSGQLVIHVRYHTGERPYKCELCPKSFAGPQLLYLHRKLHYKSKRYKCQYCSREFFWRKAYTGHVRLHTGERPYKCTFCSKAFTLKTKLNEHMKKHGGVTHTCASCGKHFGSLKELTSHLTDKCCSSTMTILEEGEVEEYIVLENDISDDQVYVMKDSIIDSTSV